MSTVGVVGAGAMGRGIVQWAAEAGHAVIVHDARPGATAEARDFVAGMLDRAVEKGRMASAARDAAVSRIALADGLEALAGAEIVVEAVVEDLAVKRDVFARLETVVGDDAVLATNTSSLSVTACAAACRLPQRVAGLHFFNPVPLMRVVEIIAGERTAPSAMDRLKALVATTSHHPVVCSDSPGFVVNHAGRGLYTEGLRIVQEGVATFADVDRVMREVCGFPMGPFELFDLTGLDVSSRVLREIYDSFFQEPRHRPNPLVYRRVDAGLHGRKAGEGFYRYENGRKVEPPEAPVPEAAAGDVHVASDDPVLRARIEALLAAGGLRAAPANAADAPIVIAPIGHDATSVAVAGGLDPRRVVALDPLLPAGLEKGGRATLMTTPVTRPAARDAVHAALARAGLKVTRIADSPGFIAQRVLAAIVNTGCEIAQQRIAARPTSRRACAAASATRPGRLPSATASARPGCSPSCSACRRSPATRATARACGCAAGRSSAFRC